ncbi:hypothetical protein CKAH01_16672 [Colletotrichum kahawae]|uniref:Uncharacterized protein n=1 Tax=Colletotrichum kahawae TaxID=34407 RepID=A0AAE0D6D1_COLKA|nr:hypothetical protein CKAH01_16672 [Colletotrichum kahawae]
MEVHEGYQAVGVPNKMAQPSSEDAWDPPANAQSHSSLMMGDSIGFKGCNGAASLGPILEFSGKYYWLVAAHILENVFSGDKKPQDVILVHPAKNDCRPGETPREIGVLKYWSGRLYKTSRESSYLKQITALHGRDPSRVITDWALCKVLDGMAVARNRLRYMPTGREFDGHSEPITSFFKGQPQLRIVQAAGRSSGLRYALVCETPAIVQHPTPGTRTREHFIENAEGYTGMISNEAWNTGGTGVPGDSGASIIDEETQKLMGIVWVRNVYGGDKRIPRVAYFTSIYDILDDVYEKYPELGLANLPGGDVYDPRTLVTTKAFYEDPANIEEKPPSGPLPGATDHSTTEPRVHPVPQIITDPEIGGSGTENVIEIDSEVESVFSDTQSLSSQSSVQATEVQALREAITSLFLSKSGVIDIFETGLRLHGIGSETMTATLRRSLRTMGAALGLDSDTVEQRICSQRIKCDAEYIANAVRKRCDPKFARHQLNVDKTPISKEDEAKFIRELWQRGRAPNAPPRQPKETAEDDPDSEDEDDDPFDSALEQELKRELNEGFSQMREKLENFILNSEHMVVLQHNLRALFVADENIHGLQENSTDGFQSVQEASARQNELDTAKGESNGLQPEDTHSDSGSTVSSSIPSMFSDLESKTSNSSFHHIETQAFRETIADLFVEDLFISNSFKDSLASGGIGAAAITKILHSALKDMGKALRVDSKTKEQKACARRVRRDAEYIAGSVRQQYDPEFKTNRLGIEHAEFTMSPEDRSRLVMNLWLRNQPTNGESAGQYEKQTEPRNPAHINPEVQGDAQSDGSDDPEAEEALKLKIQELKRFILDSEHMESLRDKLREAAHVERNYMTIITAWKKRNYRV